jgi:NAD(P)-dependent dehydrogenase (short-subunit alcohol dehydrogenase family)
MGRLEGKVALVTGGGGGLGRAMVDRFVAEGASVLILEIEPVRAKETEATLSAQGFRIAANIGDVTKEADVKEAVRSCLERWKRLDILINNAGVAAKGPANLTELDVAEWHRLLDVNLTGPMLCTRHAAPAMRDSGGGSIINVSSISSRSCYPGQGSYGISKAALDALTLQSAVELGEWNIRVNAMGLGWFRTPFNEHAYQKPGELERRNATIPIRRIGSMEDAANLALFLASDESSYITGESIESDGGLVAASLKCMADLARLRPTPGA